MARAFTEAKRQRAPLRMSYDEWQAWYGQDDLHRSEWVKGEVVPFMPALILHQRIAGFLFFLTMSFAHRRRLGEVFLDGTELWLPESQAARMPDICFVAHQHRDRITTHRVEGYADLVVEIMSTDSVARDRRQKFAEYETPGIPEYWIVDPRPRRQTMNVYVLDASGHYRDLPHDEAARLRSQVLPGFWVDPNWLWQSPLPDPYQILDQIMSDSEH